LPFLTSIRELKEELGIDVLPHFLFKSHLTKIISSTNIECEIAYAFAITSDAEPVAERNEVEEVRFLLLEDCSSFSRDNEKEVTQDAIVLTKKTSRKQ
jgi:isopentenyldiphosphate isomerase